MDRKQTVEPASTAASGSEEPGGRAVVRVSTSTALHSESLSYGSVEAGAVETGAAEKLGASKEGVCEDEAAGRLGRCSRWSISLSTINWWPYSFGKKLPWNQLESVHVIPRTG